MMEETSQKGNKEVLILLLMHPCSFSALLQILKVSYIVYSPAERQKDKAI